MFANVFLAAVRTDKEFITEPSEELVTSVDLEVVPRVNSSEWTHEQPEVATLVASDELFTEPAVGNVAEVPVARTLPPEVHVASEVPLVAHNVSEVAVHNVSEVPAAEQPEVTTIQEHPVEGKESMWSLALD